MFRLSRLVVLVCTLLLAACTSTPVHYHTLTTSPTSVGSDRQPGSFVIEVLPVGIPELVDRPQLVVRQSGSSVDIVDTERWAGSLDEEIRQALSIALTERLNTQDIAGLARPSGTPALRIKVEVRRFDMGPGAKVYLAADWSLSTAGQEDRSRLTCRAHFDVPSQTDYSQLVHAQQHALTLLAARIAADAENMVRAIEAKDEKSECLNGRS